MGSGETSPTMVTLHRELVADLGRDAAAVILETPYGFQVNRDDISARARDYFQRSVGLTTAVVPDAEPSTPADDILDSTRDQVRRAAWVFTGPGSPSYALGRWHAQGLGELLVERVRRGYGVTVMASAAACTVGFVALPVYEVYKAGHPPVWLKGLDVLGALGLPVAVIPHYDNAEGRTHDTRYCYLGETRLAALEQHLPHDSAVLGIDEHTAVIVDLGADTARVWGHGVMTLRRRGVSTLIPAGTTLPLERLRNLVTGTAQLTEFPAPRTTPADHHANAPATPAITTAAPATLQEAVHAAETRFDSARAAHDAGSMVDAILDLEAVITEWAADMEEDQGGEWARTVLRGMIRQLTLPAQQGMLEPGRTLGCILDPLLDLRKRLRTRGDFHLADHLRAALAAGGIEIRDSSERTSWRLTANDSAPPTGADTAVPPRE
ncbi:hypothetical protein QMK19_31470 [Streptomyces sp. H10-C2]|uniref:hypothetical protein n=1 Tax=unclassified Streptomyces TaxID=2593676 RepID=UPI0024B91483|nr:MULTISPECIES: hypothetical protein [unclassified Streptomyces]MDJ0346089.1 hypothetical protein [Streptomyces sp. PH10-H1]MDJ0374040.1 hypothetical protein [Streptomyces sp. H10-C2]